MHSDHGSFWKDVFSIKSPDTQRKYVFYHLDAELGSVCKFYTSSGGFLQVVVCSHTLVVKEWKIGVCKLPFGIVLKGAVNV